MALTMPHPDPGFDPLYSGRRSPWRNSLTYSNQYSPYSSSFPNYSYDSPGFYPDPYMGEFDHPQYMYPNSALIPAHRRLASTSYDDLALRDGYYGGRHLSRESLGYHPRSRRNSVSFVTHPPSIDGYRRAVGYLIEFRKAGYHMPGITLAEAQSNILLASDEVYYLDDMHADRHEHIYLKVKWVGYPSMKYQIPLGSYGDGTVDMQSLARRVARACTHYLQDYLIPIPWSCVELRHLEEVTYGTWQPILSAR